MKRNLIFCLAFIFIFISLIQAFGYSSEVIKFENQEIKTQSSTTYGQYYKAQTFVVGTTSYNTTHTLRGIGLNLLKQNVPGNINVSIRAVDPATGKPTGADLSKNSTFDGTGQLTLAADWYNITMPEIELVKGTAYAIVITSNADGIKVGNANPAPYTTGSVFNSADSGATWAEQPAEDVSFQIWGNTSALSSDITINLITPPDSYTTHLNITIFNATLSTSNNLSNATIYVWYANTTIFNVTSMNLTGNNTINNSYFNISGIPFGTFNWNVWGCAVNESGGDSKCSWAVNNFTFVRQTFTPTSIYYQNSTYDTDTSKFSINITLIPTATLFSALLNYNGTPYSAVITNLGSGSYNIRKDIDIPAVPVNTTKNFKWIFTFDLGTGFMTENSTSFNQNVLSSNITDASSPLIVNYTIFDEETLLPITANWKSSFDWYLGTGTEIKNNSYSFSTITEKDFYLIPNNRTFNTDVTINLNKPSSNYNQRTFDFNNERFNQTVTNRRLLLPNASKVSDIIVEVKDSGYTSLEGYVVKIYRFYPELNQYNLVESRETDGFGQFVALLVQNEVKYKFEFYDTTGDLVKTVNIVNIACRSSICVLPFVIEDTTNPFERYGNLTNYESTLSFNNATHIYTFSWVDNTGDTSVYHNLLVEKIALNGTITICNTTSNALAGALTCAVGDGKASYNAQAFRVASPGVRKSVLSNKVGGNSATFGLEGLMWGFILLATLILLGIYNPSLGIATFLVGFLFLGLFDIVYINPAIFIAMLALGVAFIWSFRN